MKRPRSRSSARRACLIVVALLCVPMAVALRVAPARADGDPASDVLLGQDVFLPYGSISASTQRRLFAVAAALTATEPLAAAAGHPLPPGAPTASANLGASSASIRHALIAIAILALIAAAGIGAALRARTRSDTL